MEPSFKIYVSILSFDILLTTTTSRTMNIIMRAMENNPPIKTMSKGWKIRTMTIKKIKGGIKPMTEPTPPGAFTPGYVLDIDTHVNIASMEINDDTYETGIEKTTINSNMFTAIDGAMKFIITKIVVRSIPKIIDINNIVTIENDRKISLILIFPVAIKYSYTPFDRSVENRYVTPIPPMVTIRGMKAGIVGLKTEVNAGDSIIDLKEDRRIAEKVIGMAIPINR